VHPLEALVRRIDATGDGHASPADGSVPSGFPALDRLLGGGLRPQDLVILGGDVGSGKSALALAMAIRAARAGSPVIVLSGEMSADRVLERALAIEARVDIDTLRSGALTEEQRAAVGGAAVALRGLPLTVKPMLGDGFAEIDAALDALPRPRLLIVDSLQLVAPPLPTARTEERAALSARALKALALRRDVAVLTTAQLPLFKAARPDPRPTLADHGGRGAIRQIADVVLGLYREEMYANAQGVEGAAELLVSKQRNGPTGFADLYFYRRFLRFEDMVDPST
jgi:replicative DNA helicase